MMPDPNDPIYADERALGLDQFSYQSDAKSYRLRLDHIHGLAVQGLGPGAFLADFLEACGYRDPRRAE